MRYFKIISTFGSVVLPIELSTSSQLWMSSLILKDCFANSYRQSSTKTLWYLFILIVYPTLSGSFHSVGRVSLALVVVPWGALVLVLVLVLALLLVPWGSISIVLVLVLFYITITCNISAQRSLQNRNNDIQSYLPIAYVPISLQLVT